MNDRNRGTDYYDIFLIKINERYELEYNKIIRSEYNDWPSGILLDKENIYLFGEIHNNNNKELYFLCLDQQGSLISVKSYKNQYKDISLRDAIITDNGLIGVGSKWKEKRAGMLFNTMNLVESENKFNIIDGDFRLEKLGKGQFINLNKKETIEPVNLKEWEN